MAGTMLDGTTRFTDKNGESLRHCNFVSGFSSHSVVPEDGVIPTDKEFPLDIAALMSCCIPTGWGAVYNTANVKPGDSVAVWGLGGVGLNIVRAARMRQAYPVIAVDLEGAKEDLARECGATHFICNGKEDPVPVIQSLTGHGADIVFEAIGDPGAIEPMLRQSSTHPSRSNELTSKRSSHTMPTSSLAVAKTAGARTGGRLKLFVRCRSDCLLEWRSHRPRRGADSAVSEGLGLLSQLPALHREACDGKACRPGRRPDHRDRTGGRDVMLKFTGPHFLRRPYSPAPKLPGRWPVGNPLPLPIPPAGPSRSCSARR